MKLRYTKLQPVGFQMTAMMDVVFLLLAFFVVTYRITMTEQDLDVKVPNAKQAVDPDSRMRDEIIINVRVDGSVNISGNTYDQNKLFERLKDYTRTNKSLPIRIRGDADTKYARIVEVLDVCRKAGIYNISFSAQRPQQQSAQ